MDYGYFFCLPTVWLLGDAKAIFFGATAVIRNVFYITTSIRIAFARVLSETFNSLPTPYLPSPERTGSKTQNSSGAFS